MEFPGEPEALPLLVSLGPAWSPPPVTLHARRTSSSTYQANVQAVQLVQGYVQTLQDVPCQAQSQE